MSNHSELHTENIKITQDNEVKFGTEINKNKTDTLNIVDDIQTCTSAEELDDKIIALNKLLTCMADGSREEIEYKKHQWWTSELEQLKNSLKALKKQYLLKFERVYGS